MPDNSAPSARPPKDPLAYREEHRAHRVRLPRFFIARYPVTVAQWRAYHRATGAEIDERSLQGAANHPVVCVSWRDAVAYCAWLTEVLRERARQESARPAGVRTVPGVLATLLLQGDGSSNPWAVMLPSEAEWERTARGPHGRRYPWGGTRIDANLANCFDPSSVEALAATSAVGCFSRGRTPESRVEELLGNVWEWTRSEWIRADPGPKPSAPRNAARSEGRPDYPYIPGVGREAMDASSASPRVRRGGSIFVPRKAARAAFRDFTLPDVRLEVIGFRVVVAPFSL